MEKYWNFKMHHGKIVEFYFEIFSFATSEIFSLYACDWSFSFCIDHGIMGKSWDFVLGNGWKPCSRDQ